MKISLNWMKDYVTHGLSTEKLSHKLTMAGLETEEIVNVGSNTIMEFEITPNRADCLSMIGMAREIATVTEKKLKIPPVKKVVYPKKKYTIKIEDTKDCKQYLGTVIENIDLKSSSTAIKERISSLGHRPISNIVDITNFVMLEQGQPLHAFDLDKIEGGKIIVRRAKKGEKILTIDGVERTLDSSILVIADEKRPVAIAGIMGGKDTEVGPNTKNILLESAYFDPILIRRASRKLGLSSDSSYRFERGVDFEGVPSGSARAIEMILKEAGGKVTLHGRAGLSKNPFVRKMISLNVDELNARLGTQVTAAKVKNILTSLGFKVGGQSKNLKATAPSFRSDIFQDVDLIEEVARIIGYDALPTSIPVVPTSAIDIHAGKSFRDQAREILLGQGLSEAVTLSLLSQSDLDRSGLSHLKSLAIINPLSLDQALMRPSSLPSMLAIARNNINRGQKDIRLFELAKIYTSEAKELETLSIVLSGNQTSDWRRKDDLLDVYDLKGMVAGLCQRMSLGKISLKKEDYPFLEKKQSAAVYLDNKEIGCLGSVHSQVLKNWEIKDADVYFAEIKLPKPEKQKNKKFKTMSDFPAIVQDVSLAVKENIHFNDIEEIARTQGQGLLHEVAFKELYLGEKIQHGYRGLVFSLIYQSDQRTLREEDVLRVHEHIVLTIVKQLEAIRR